MFAKAVFSLTIFATGLAAAGAARAQDIDLLPGPPDPVVEKPRQQLFISPAGEPFRAAPGQPYPVAGWFARADADHDGTLTAAEFQADELAFFKTLDANSDGVVVGFEATAYERDIVPELQPREGRGMGPGRKPRKKGGFFGIGGRPVPAGTGRQGAGVYGLLNEPLPVRAADSDFDYKVTVQEAKAAAERRFGLLDADKNGRLTLGELPKTPFQAFVEQRRQRGPRPAPAETRLQPSGGAAIPEA